MYRAAFVLLLRVSCFLQLFGTAVFTDQGLYVVGGAVAGYLQQVVFGGWGGYAGHGPYLGVADLTAGD
jgi:hypothetical protein